MGAFTPIDQIWYPDEDDTAEQNVNIATLASSLEDGIGARLRHQEIAVGLKASIGMAAYTIPLSTPGVIPYINNGVQGDFTQGMSLTAGVATVATAGMYMVTAMLGTQGTQPGAGIKLFIDKNNNFVGASEVVQDSNIWGSTSVTVVINCVPGDTIRARGTITGGSFAQKNSSETTHISIAMIQALPL